MNASQLQESQGPLIELLLSFDTALTRTRSEFSIMILSIRQSHSLGGKRMSSCQRIWSGRGWYAFERVGPPCVDKGRLLLPRTCFFVLRNTQAVYMYEMY